MNQADLSARLDRYVSFWGDEGLHKYPAGELWQVGLPVQVINFLTDVGLPLKTSLSFRAASDAELLKDIRGAGRFVVVAYDCSTPVCMDVKSGCEIVELDEYCAEVKYVMASDIVRFALLVTEYEYSNRKGCGLSGGQQLAVVDSMEKEMRIIDPIVMDDPKGGWPLIIWDIRQSIT